MRKFLQKIKQEKKLATIFGVIIFVGIFLRTYNFHDWMRFSEDQARDAGIISAAIENKAPLPLLGPNAGATKFLLGPMYYYLSYISARIFGNNPVAMAYPSLFSSILAIPLLFLFLREYFEEKMSLALMAIMSVSYFLVISSRFSSNPNLVPFFLLLCLYSLLKILNSQGKNSSLWSIVLGIGLGMGIQMHTTFLIIMPLVSLCVFPYLLIRKTPGIWKGFFIVLAIVGILNASQLVSEMNSNWQNYKNFTSGFTHSSGGEKDKSNFVSNVVTIAVCQAHANAFMVSSMSDDVPCRNILNATQINGSSSSYYLGIAIEILFSLASYLMLGYRFVAEKETEKKNFLALIIILNLFTFLIFIPIASIMVVGYFIVVFLVPFVLLGLLLEIIMNKYGRIGNIIAAITVATLLILSLSRDYALAVNYTKGGQDNITNSTLGEVEPMAQYILATSKNSSKIYFSGQYKLDVRYYDAVGYFVREAGISTVLLQSTEKDKAEPGFPLYYIKNNDSDGVKPGQIINGHAIISGKIFASQTLLILNN
jgi:hypothetical protein